MKCLSKMCVKREKGKLVYLLLLLIPFLCHTRLNAQVNTGRNIDKILQQHYKKISTEKFTLEEFKLLQSTIKKTISPAKPATGSVLDFVSRFKDKQVYDLKLIVTIVLHESLMTNKEVLKNDNFIYWLGFVARQQLLLLNDFKQDSYSSFPIFCWLRGIQVESLASLTRKKKEIEMIGLDYNKFCEAVKGCKLNNKIIKDKLPLNLRDRYNSWRKVSKKYSKKTSKINEIKIAHYKKMLVREILESFNAQSPSELKVIVDFLKKFRRYNNKQLANFASGLFCRLHSDKDIKQKGIGYLYWFA